MTFTEAAEAVLRKIGKPLHYKKITQHAIDQQLLSHMGKTPEVTMSTRLATLTKKDRGEAAIVRIKPGVFGLREWNVSEADVADEPSEEEVSEEAETPEAQESTEETNPVETSAEQAVETQVPVQAPSPEEKEREDRIAAAAQLFPEEEDDDEPVLGDKSGSSEFDRDGRRKKRKKKPSLRGENSDSLDGSPAETTDAELVKRTDDLEASEPTEGRDPRVPVELVPQETDTFERATEPTVDNVERNAATPEATEGQSTEETETRRETRHGRRDDRNYREPREGREPRERRDYRDNRDVRESREPREPRETREVREREPRENRENRENREGREPREPREPRETREPREPREAREGREGREPRDSRDFRDREPREARDLRDDRESREARDPRETRERNGFRDDYDRVKEAKEEEPRELGRDAADLLVSLLQRREDRQSVPLRNLIDDAIRAGKLSGDPYLLLPALAAAARADTSKRETRGERARIRLVGNRVSLVDWALGLEYVRAETEALSALERLREIVRRQLLRKLNELPQASFTEMLAQLVEKFGISNLKTAKKPSLGGPHGETHLTGIARRMGEEQKVGVLLKRGGEIGRERVLELRGSPQHYGGAHAFWVFTTGNVLAGAKEEALTAGLPVTLLDGAALSRLCDEHKVGVCHAEWSVPQIDLDLFESLRG